MLKISMHRGTGADLRDLLIRELSIPNGAKWFEVKFHADGQVTVACEYFPDELPQVADEPDQPDPPSYGGLNG
ncbi:hypothetical protein [Variovorax paradoxus]|uniref:hypothetical protein n=1 Tax=Variovorax paradoxus TaxID=34073 RepID=UPI0030CFECC3